MKLSSERTTWEYDGDRYVYLVRFNIPYPEDKLCPKCWKEIRLTKNGDEWEEHMQTHRLWHYADTGERYYGWREQHRFCECSRHPLLTALQTNWRIRDGIAPVDSNPKYPSMFCPDCGGYISILST